jgi:predicted esterase
MTQSIKSALKTTRNARYFTLNSAQEQTENIWVVFHGYGQLAEYFIKHFENLDTEKNFIVAPEGLSRFYVDGLTGRVGASWMTKDDRELEIEDQTEYINAVLADCGVNPKSKNQRFIVLGFSQGTATAVRWFANSGIRPAELVLWAGSFPHDVDTSQHQDIFSGLSTHFVHGTEDPFLQNVNVSEKTAEFEKMGMNVSVWPFDGKHAMDKPTLEKIVNSFAP